MYRGGYNIGNNVRQDGDILTGNRVRLVYNPVAGDRGIKNKLDYIIERYQREGLQIEPYRTTGRHIGREVFAEAANNPEAYHSILASGGDGTIHHVVQGMMNGNINLPLGIIPAGTVNDFAEAMGIPYDIEKCCDMLLGGKTRRVDIGRAGDRFFINTASAGFFTDVPYKTKINYKNLLGRAAYYLKGIEELPRFRPLNMKITYSEGTIQSQMLFVAVLNTNSVGGFNRAAPGAIVNDGKLDVVALKSCNLLELLPLLIKFLRGAHISDPNIYYFQTEKLRIECGECDLTDLDGEKGPSLPMDIEVIPGALKVIM